jgi:hypothetical protein
LSGIINQPPTFSTKLGAADDAVCELELDE